MMKTSRIRKGLILLACGSLAGIAAAQEQPGIGQPTPAQPGLGQPGLGRTEVTAQTTTSAEAPLILRLGQIQVKDISGQQLGTLEDIVVSPDGRIDMGIVSLGGTRLVPVPWQMVRADQAGIATATATPTAVTVQVDRTRLQQAPSIDRAQLRTQLAQAGFTQQINTFFGVQGNVNTSAGGLSATNLQGNTNVLGRFDTNQFGMRTNMFPTGRTNLFRGSTNSFPPGRNLGRPEGTPPGVPGTPPPNTPPGTSPTFPNPQRPPGSGTGTTP
jgi:hypothetical protein